MKRTVNLTGKKRITQDLVSAEFIDEGASHTAKVSWDLSSLNLDPGMEIIFETYSFGQTSRDAVQLLENEVASRIINLVNFKKDSSISLYVRVVDATSPVRRIVAESASIALLPGVAKEGNNSLLKVQAKSDLQSLWQIDFSIGEPVLQISNRNGIYGDLIAEPVFFASVLPAAVSEIAFVIIAQADLLNADTLKLWESAFRAYGLSEARLGELRGSLTSEEYLGDSLISIKDEANSIAQRFAAKFDLTRLSRTPEGDF